MLTRLSLAVWRHFTCYIFFVFTDYVVLSLKNKYTILYYTTNMKVSEQCRIAASKGNQVLGTIRTNITYKENSLIVPLYKPIVRPHLEYSIQAWSPYLRKYIDMLEQIQRRATKLIPGLRDLRYEERLI